jgi:hypothetical protein
LETYNDGFEPNNARRALYEFERFSTSTDGSVSAAGVLGRITGTISVSEVKPRFLRELTTLAKKIHVPFIRFFARFLARFFKLASLLPCNSMNDV